MSKVCTNYIVVSYLTFVSPSELLSLMHFLMPEKCMLYISMTREVPEPNIYITVQLTNEFDLTDADHEEKIKELHNQLESYMLRRLKRDVLVSLPTKSERILRVEMSSLQTHWYKNILTKVWSSAHSVIT